MLINPEKFDDNDYIPFNDNNYKLVLKWNKIYTNLKQSKYINNYKLKENEYTKVWVKPTLIQKVLFWFNKKEDGYVLLNLVFSIFNKEIIPAYTANELWYNMPKIICYKDDKDYYRAYKILSIKNNKEFLMRYKVNKVKRNTFFTEDFCYYVVSPQYSNYLESIIYLIDKFCPSKFANKSL